MRKRAARVRVMQGVAMLVVGAALAIATAWGAVIWEAMAPGGWGMTFPRDSPRRAVSWEWTTTTECRKFERRGCTARVFISYRSTDDPAFALLGDLRGSLREEECGFPLRALGRWQIHGPSADQPTTLRSTRHGAWTIPLPALGTHELPVTPLWPGFALNTLFYAALAWGLWQLPLALRRRSRSKKGLYVRCGYDLKGLAAESACPECGMGRGSGQ